MQQFDKGVILTLDEFQKNFSYDGFKDKYNKSDKSQRFYDFMVLELNIYASGRFKKGLKKEFSIFFASEILEIMQKYSARYANEKSLTKVFSSNEMRTYHIARKNVGKTKKTIKEGKNGFQLAITQKQTKETIDTLKNISDENYTLDYNLSTIQDAIMVMLENLVIESNVISEEGKQMRSVTLTHADYCRMRGKEPSKRTREDFKNNCIAMMCTSAVWTDKNGKRAPIHIFSDNFKTDRNGNITQYDTFYHKYQFTVKFSDTFMQFMLAGKKYKNDKYIMKFPTEIFKISLKKYDLAISIYYNMVYFVKMNNNVCCNCIDALVGDYIKSFTSNNNENRAMKKIFENINVLKQYGVNLEYIIDGQSFEELDESTIEKYNLKRWENVKDVVIKYSIDGLTYKGKNRINTTENDSQQTEKG